MTPELRARMFIDTIEDGWGEKIVAEDAAALAVVIRQAENDAIERAAVAAEESFKGVGFQLKVLGEASRAIRSLKHPE